MKPDSVLTRQNVLLRGAQIGKHEDYTSRFHLIASPKTVKKKLRSSVLKKAQNR